MKVLRSVIPIVALAVGIVASASGSAHAEIRWETKLERAATAARETNQPMLIEFWATWCEVCKEMDRDVYADERVADAMARVRPVKVDIDREPAIARKYEITGTPTLVLADSYGRELFRYAGALPLERMVQLLRALPPDIGRINQYSSALAANKDDFSALNGLGRALRDAGFFRTSSQYYARALKTADGRRAGEARAAILVDLQRNDLELRLYLDAARLSEQALREVRGGPRESEVLVDYARALLGLSRDAEARKTLQDVVARFAGTPAAIAAADLLRR